MGVSISFVLDDHTFDNVPHQCKEKRCKQDCDDVAQGIKGVVCICIKLLPHNEHKYSANKGTQDEVNDGATVGQAPSTACDARKEE